MVRRFHGLLPDINSIAGRRLRSRPPANQVRRRALHLERVMRIQPLRKLRPCIQLAIAVRAIEKETADHDENQWRFHFDLAEKLSSRSSNGCLFGRAE